MCLCRSHCHQTLIQLAENSIAKVSLVTTLDTTQVQAKKLCLQVIHTSSTKAQPQISTEKQQLTTTFAEKKSGLSILEPNPPEARIIGGEKAIPHSFPYQAALIINDDTFCGGVLISPNYVLTVAHRLQSAERVEVILGAHNVFEDEETQVIIYAQEKIIHEGFDAISLENDIGLIKLDKPAPINEVIHIATLPPLTDLRESYSGKIVTATGWGSSDPSKEDVMSDVLLKVDLLVMDLTDCMDFYREHGSAFVYTSVICTSGDQNKGICVGDGGGPLLLDGVLIGLTSFSYGQCGTGNPQAYTRVVDYLDWIVTNSDVKISS